MWVACSYRPGRQFSWSRWRELFSSGKHLLGSRMIDIVTQRYDSLVIGARLGPAALGLYSASFRLYSALMDVLFASVNRVTLPAFARIIKDSERVQRALLRLIRFTSFFTFPTFAAIAVVSEPLIITLLGSAWRDSAPILSALCIGGLLSSVSHFSAPLLNAKGRTDLLLRQMIVNAILVIVAVSVGSLWGAFGVAAGVVLRGYALLPVSLAFLQRATGLRPAKWLLNVAPPLFATCVSSGFLATIQWLALPSVSAPWRLLALIAIFPPLHAVVVLLLIPGRAAAVADELAALWSGGTGMANALHRWEAMVRPRKD
jgi:O-antigen/teichoic acid export membrane protein